MKFSTSNTLFNTKIDDASKTYGHLRSFYDIVVDGGNKLRIEVL
jgi:hypothetical protein